MITGVENSFLNWIYGQLVTDPQMNLLTQDLYNKIGALTETTFPCIISGANATISGSNVTITDSFCRAENQSPVFLSATNVQGFMNVPATSIAVTPSYYIVATLDISPPAGGQITYTFTGSYQLIQALTSPYYDPTIMVIIGQIDATGTYVIFQERDKDFGNLLNIIALQQLNLKNSNYTILATDTTVTTTSTTPITYTMPGYKTLGQNYQVTIQNLGTSQLTVNGNGININGNSTIIINPYGSATLTYNNLINQWIANITGASSYGSQTFSSSGTFTPTTSTIWITAIAPGGGGAGSYSASNFGESGGGGGSGDYIIKQAFTVTIGVPISITIGSPGTGGAPGAGSVGTTGGNLTIGSLITLNGGLHAGDGTNNLTPGGKSGTNSSPGVEGMQLGSSSSISGTFPGGQGGVGIFSGAGNNFYDSEFGSGGAGAQVTIGGSTFTGKAGGGGFVLIEY